MPSERYIENKTFEGFFFLEGNEQISFFSPSFSFAAGNGGGGKKSYYDNYNKRRNGEKRGREIIYVAAEVDRRKQQ